MTVTTELAVATFAWTGVETSFACGFPADRIADLVVAFRSPGGVDTALTLGVNYTAILAAGTKIATVTPLSLPGTTGTVVVARNTPAMVNENLVDGQEFSAAVIQQLHDRAAMRSAEDRAQLNRAFQLKPGATLGAGNFDLEGSGIDGLKDGVTPQSAATIKQVQNFTAVAGNVPPPVEGDAGKVLVVPPSLIPEWGEVDLDPFEAALALRLRIDADQGLNAAQQGFGRANISALASSQSGFRNLLINPSFRINQRAYAGAVLGAGVYAHDRWKAGPAGASYTVAAGVATISGTLVQVVEGASIEFDEHYVINWQGTAVCTVNGVAATKGQALTLTAGSNVTVTFSGGTLSQPQLESGTIATMYERRPIGLEMDLCLRYFEILGGATGGSIYEMVGVGRADGTTQADFLVSYGRKRASPTVTVLGSATDFGAYASGLTAATTLTVVSNTNRAASADIRMATASGLTAGQCYLLAATNGSRLSIDAEL